MVDSEDTEYYGLAGPMIPKAEPDWIELKATEAIRGTWGTIDHKGDTDDCHKADQGNSWWIQGRYCGSLNPLIDINSQVTYNCYHGYSRS